MSSVSVFVMCLVIFGMIPNVGWGQQIPLSCEDQLAEVTTTLSFVRAARQTTEEIAGRVTATLQKRLDASLKEVEVLKHTSLPAPTPFPSEPAKKEDIL